MLIVQHVIAQPRHQPKTKSASIPPTGDEFVGPFESWLNVKKDFGAVGDGVHDDTRAIQYALNILKNAGKSIVLYLPKGTYLVNNTLRLDNAINVSVIGEDPNTTVIKWGGPASGIMFGLNGTAYSKFDRLTFSGMHNAAIAVDQSYSGSGGHFDTANEWADDYFIDVATGIHGGFQGHGFAEVTIERDRFIRNTVAGVSLGNFNALDVWVRSCLFQDCNYGVTNTSGAGNFKIYSCVFQNSATADIAINNTGEFAVRENTSINSKVFYYTSYSRNPCSQIITGNTVIDPVANAAVVVQNQGPVTFANNTIYSGPQVQAPVVIFQNYHPYNNSTSLNNTFTVANAIAADHIINYGDKKLSLTDMRKPVVRELPGIPPNLHRKVFEVPQGAGAEVIQSLINKAAVLSGTRPVIHFPYGIYRIASTLTVPANADMQLVGDGFGDVHASLLVWEGVGAGPVIKVNGPSKVTFRNFSLFGSAGRKLSDVTGIQLNQVDQPGASIFLKETQARAGGNGLLVNGTNHVVVWCEDTGFGGLLKAFSISGGAMQVAGKPAEGRTVIYNGAESDNQVSHEVTNGGYLLLQDSWYEGGGKNTFANLEGNATFCASGVHIYSPFYPGFPFFGMNNFSGKAVVIGSYLNGNIELADNKSKMLVLGNVFEKTARPEFKV